VNFARNVRLIIRQFLRKIDHLASDHPTGTTGKRKQKDNDQQYRRNTSDPTFHSDDEAGEEERNQCRQRQGNEECVSEIERSDNKGEKQDGPNAFERAGGRRGHV